MIPTQQQKDKIFGLIDNEFINLYSKENPILTKNDICYCLITNIIDFHRPLIVKAIILDDVFLDTLHKTYYIQITEILESLLICEEFVYGKSFYTYGKEELVKGGQQKRRATLLGPNFDFENSLFKVNCFFMRSNEENILKLRKEYISVIKTDIEKQLADINSILI